MAVDPTDKSGEHIAMQKIALTKAPPGHPQYNQIVPKGGIISNLSHLDDDEYIAMRNANAFLPTADYVATFGAITMQEPAVLIESPGPPVELSWLGTDIHTVGIATPGTVTIRLNINPEENDYRTFYLHLMSLVGPAVGTVLLIDDETVNWIDDGSQGTRYVLKNPTAPMFSEHYEFRVIGGVTCGRRVDGLGVTPQPVTVPLDAGPPPVYTVDYDEGDAFLLDPTAAGTIEINNASGRVITVINAQYGSPVYSITPPTGVSWLGSVPTPSSGAVYKFTQRDGTLYGWIAHA